MSMQMEWLRGGDGTPPAGACFLVHPDMVSVLATLTNGLVDRDMTVDAARQLWVDLCQQGWRRVAEQEELNACRAGETPLPFVNPELWVEESHVIQIVRQVRIDRRQSVGQFLNGASG
jgi:hypothetical protein